MVNFKTRYFVHRGIKTLQFMFGRKILHFEDINKDNLLNKRSEIFGKCRHKNRFRALFRLSIVSPTRIPRILSIA
jgi:hypothetical protein